MRFFAEVKETGITIHYIDKGIDTGPIIHQETIEITKEDTLDSLEAKIHQIEHQTYPKIIEAVIKEMQKVEEEKND